MSNPQWVKITFVNERDEVIGSGYKEEAWAKGIFHRIVGIFILNSGGELLIHKRSPKLLTSPGLWDKSAGGHVDEGEDYLTAAKRETKEEIGIGVELQEITKFLLKEVYKDGKRMNRFHMLYKGEYDGEIFMDKREVLEIRWISLPDLEKWMKEKPEDFVYSFLVQYKHFKGSDQLSQSGV